MYIFATQISENFVPRFLAIVLTFVKIFAKHFIGINQNYVFYSLSCIFIEYTKILWAHHTTMGLPSFCFSTRGLPSHFPRFQQNRGKMSGPWPEPVLTVLRTRAFHSRTGRSKRSFVTNRKAPLVSA